MVRICTWMMREPFGRVQAKRTATATSSASSVSDCCPLLRSAFADSEFGLHAAGTDRAYLMPCGRNSLPSPCAKPTCANLVAQ